MQSMKPKQRKAYLAKLGLSSKRVRGIHNTSIV